MIIFLHTFRLFAEPHSSVSVQFVTAVMSSSHRARCLPLFLVPSPIPNIIYSMLYIYCELRLLTPLNCLTTCIKLSQVKLKAMKSHEEQVTQLSGQVAALHADDGIVESVQGDLDRLNTCWTDTFEKLGEFSFRPAACGHATM